MEREWANALKEGKTVEVEITSVYNTGNNSVRPDSFEVKYKIEGGEWETETFANG